MKIYASGKSGTIGRHLSKMTTSVQVNLALSNIHLPREMLEDEGAYIHLAGIVGPQAVENDLHLAHQVNVASVEIIGKTVLKSKLRKLVFVSSSHVYDRSNEPINESHATMPRNTYSKQKLEAENILQDIFSGDSERLSIVRIFSVLDWDVKPFTLGGGIRRVIDPDSDFALRNCDDIRDFLTPNVIASTLEEITLSNQLAGVINLCSGKGISVGEAARTMITRRGVSTPESRLLPGNSESPSIVGDNRKLLSALPHLNLNWEPSG